MTVRDRIQGVFWDVFDAPDLVLQDEMKGADIPGWDSLNYIKLIVGIESEFGVRFTGDEISSLTCVGDLVGLLAKRGYGDE